MMRYKLIMICLVWPALLPAQSFIGEYGPKKDSTSYGSYSISINKDGNYSYFASWCLATSQSEGKWIFKNDTLYLQDGMDKGFDITVKESFNRKQKGIKVNWVVYSDSTYEGDVQLIPNGDSNRICFIYFDSYNFTAGTLKNFRLSYLRKLQSKEYTVKSKRSNVFDIIINSKVYLEAYLPLRNIKLALRSDNSVQYIDPDLKDYPDPIYLYRKQ